jgi:hypothetical protein
MDPAVMASLRRRAARDCFTPTEVAVEVLADVFQGREGYMLAHDLPTLLDKLLPDDVGEAEVEWISMLAEGVTGEVHRRDISFALLSWHGYRMMVRNFVHLFARFDVKAANTFADDDAETIMVELTGGIPVSPVEARRVVDLADQLDRGTVRRFDIMAAIGTWYMDTDAAPMKAPAALQTGLSFAGSQVAKVNDHSAAVVWAISVAQIVAAVVFSGRLCLNHLDSMLVVQAVIVVAQKYAPSLGLAVLLVSLAALRSVVDFSPSQECSLSLVVALVALLLIPLPFLLARIVFFLRLTVAYLSTVRELQATPSGLSRLRATCSMSMSRSASVVSILRTPDMSPKTRHTGGCPLSPDPGSISSSFKLLETTPKEIDSPKGRLTIESPEAAARFSGRVEPRLDGTCPSERV